MDPLAALTTAAWHVSSPSCSGSAACLDYYTTSQFPVSQFQTTAGSRSGRQQAERLTRSTGDVPTDPRRQSGRIGEMHTQLVAAILVDRPISVQVTVDSEDCWVERSVEAQVCLEALAELGPVVALGTADSCNSRIGIAAALGIVVAEEVGHGFVRRLTVDAYGDLGRAAKPVEPQRTCSSRRGYIPECSLTCSSRCVRR